MDDVHASVWNASFLGELNEKLSCSWILLRWLDDHGVSGGQGDREHPKWDHSREVEGTNSSGDSERNSVRVGIHVAGHVWKSLSHHQRRHGAGVLDNLKTSADISFGVWKGLPLLNRDTVSELLHVSLDQGLELEHRLLTGQWGSILPGVKRVLGRVDGSLHFGLSGIRNKPDDFVGGRVCQLDEVSGL